MTSPSQIHRQACVRIILNWPAKNLSPNARVDWRVKHRAASSARKNAAWAAVDAVGRDRIVAGPLSVTTTFFPPDRRARDEDNLKASMKSVYDGIADGIGVDDKWFRHQPVVIGEPVKGGRVVVEIEVIT